MKKVETVTKIILFYGYCFFRYSIEFLVNFFTLSKKLLAGLGVLFAGLGSAYQS
jgi:hypothetical protein